MFEKWHSIRYFFWISVLFLCWAFISGCQGHQDAKNRSDAVKSKDIDVIHLDQLSPLPRERQNLPVPLLRLAVAAIMSPEGNVESYAPLIKYLEWVTGRKVELIQRKTYGEVNEMIASGQVDLAFICTGAYMKQGQRRDMSLLVTPQINGKDTYRAVILVPASGHAKGFQDLKHGVFAFTDPISNTGYLYPMSLLDALGERPDSFFKRTFFTYSHDRAIDAVAEGLADGASVDEIVYRHALKKRPELAQKVRVIHISQEFGMPPVVVPANTDPAVFKAFQDIFLHMHENQEGRKVLNAIGVDRFLEPNPLNYSLQTNN